MQPLAIYDLTLLDVVPLYMAQQEGLSRGIFERGPCILYTVRLFNFFFPLFCSFV